MKLSIYTSAFNLHKNGFADWEKSFESFSEFADEVVVAINTSEDSTLQSVEALPFSNIRIVKCDIPYTDPLLDGKLKNRALQACSGDILVQLDMDEYIPLWQKDMWYSLGRYLLCFDGIDCFMIPSLNLYKDKNHYKDISQKWYMHKRGLFRGPVNFARKKDGTIDTSKSDGCELIDSNSNLVRWANTSHAIDNNDCPFVVHTGYLDLQARLKRNKEFWLQHWLTESGGDKPPHKVHEKMEDFDEEYFPHNFKL
jgi:hypothetical protein